MTTRSPFSRPRRDPALTLWAGVLYGLAIVLPCLVMLAVWAQPWVPVYELLGDPKAVAEWAEYCCHTYYGIVSNLGVLVWWLAAAISGFTAIVLFARDGFSEDCRFLASAALFTAILTLDDFLILHENVLPSLGGATSGYRLCLCSRRARLSVALPIHDHGGGLLRVLRRRRFATIRNQAASPRWRSARQA